MKVALLHIEYPELISFVVVPSCCLSLAVITVNMLVGQQHGQFKIQILLQYIRFV